MKLSKMKGIAHDLATHLDNHIWFGFYKDIKKDLTTDIIENKNSFDTMCIAFFKERLPESFDWSRMKKLVVKIHRTMTTLHIKVEGRVDDMEFSYNTTGIKT